MKTLLLLRHAKAENAAGSLPDFDRALNDRGKAEALAVGGYIKKQNLKFDLVLSSPALRARETTELVLNAAGLHTDIRFDQRIYDAGWLQLFALLSEVKDRTNDLVLVGHNPGLEDLILTLTGCTEHLSPGALARINLNSEEWKENTGTLDWLVNPKQLFADADQ